MSKKKTRVTPWEEDTMRIAWTMNQQERPTKEIIRAIRNYTDGRIVKSKSSIHSLTHGIRKGNIPTPRVYDEIPEKALGKRTDDHQSWTPEQKEWLVQQRTLGNDEGALRPYSVLAEEFNTKFGTNRSSGSLQQMASMISLGKTSYHGLKRAKRIDLEELKKGENPIRIVTPEDKGLIEKLTDYDANKIIPALEKRRKLVHGYMSEQANRIKNYDALRSFSQDGKVGIEDLLKLDPAQKERVIALLRNEQDAEVKKVEFFSVPRIGDQRGSASVILPVYLGAVQSSSSRSLASCLNDAFYTQVASKSAGFAESDNPAFEDKFDEFVMYNIVPRGRGWNYGFIEEKINEQVRSEFPEVSVGILHDKSILDFMQKGA